jgi:hypothetical protein
MEIFQEAQAILLFFTHVPGQGSMPMCFGRAARGERREGGKSARRLIEIRPRQRAGWKAEIQRAHGKDSAEGDVMASKHCKVFLPTRELVDPELKRSGIQIWRYETMY